MPNNLAGITVGFAVAVAVSVHYLLKQYVQTLTHYLSTIEIINRLIEKKDPYTSGHSERVQELAVRLATKLQLKAGKIRILSRSALLHDLGKVGIPDAILLKPDRLTTEEYEVIKQHPEIGAQIIADSSYLKDCIDSILYHHERYDGGGYPQGLKGDSIPIEAAIIAVVDAYDAMTSYRPYRMALTKKQALDEIRVNIGKQFNPDVARAFIELAEDDV